MISSIIFNLLINQKQFDDESISDVIVWEEVRQMYCNLMILFKKYLKRVPALIILRKAEAGLKNVRGALAYTMILKKAKKKFGEKTECVLEFVGIF